MRHRPVDHCLDHARSVRIARTTDMAREGRLWAFGGIRAGGSKLAERIRTGALSGFGAGLRESVSPGSSVARSTMRLAIGFGSRGRRGRLSVVYLIWQIAQV